MKRDDHVAGQETSANGREVRATCTCTYHGPWRFAKHPQIDKQLRSDHGGHLYAVKRRSW